MWHGTAMANRSWTASGGRFGVVRCRHRRRGRALEWVQELEPQAPTSARAAATPPRMANAPSGWNAACATNRGLGRIPVSAELTAPVALTRATVLTGLTGLIGETDQIARRATPATATTNAVAATPAATAATAAPMPLAAARA